MSATAQVEIRAYRPGDEGDVIALWREVWPDAPTWNVPENDIALKLGVQPEMFLVALIDKRLVGTTMGGFDGHRGWVHLVAVEPALQRSGIGAALMHRVEEKLRDIGCTKINLQVRAGNEAVVKFYQQLGYAVEERVSMGKRL